MTRSEITQCHCWKLSGSALLSIDYRVRPEYLEYDNIHVLLNCIKDSKTCLREHNHTILYKRGLFSLWKRLTLEELHNTGFIEDQNFRDEFGHFYSNII